MPVLRPGSTRDQQYYRRDETAKLSRLTASPQVLITAGTRIITCVSRVLHVFTTCAERGWPRAKFLSSSKLFTASNAVSISPRVLPRL